MITEADETQPLTRKPIDLDAPDDGSFDDVSFMADKQPIDTTQHLQKDQSWHRQSRWLEAFPAIGNIQGTCQVVQVHRSRVHRWITEDINGFAERFARAKAQRGEFLESVVNDRLLDPKGNRGSDVLLLGALNAEMPDKYKRNTGGLEENTGRELLSELKSLRALATRNVPTSTTGADAASIQVTKVLEAKGVKDASS